MGIILLTNKEESNLSFSKNEIQRMKYKEIQISFFFFLGLGFLIPTVCYFRGSKHFDLTSFSW